MRVLLRGLWWQMPKFNVPAPPDRARELVGGWKALCVRYQRRSLLTSKNQTGNRVRGEEEEREREGGRRGAIQCNKQQDFGGVYVGQQHARERVGNQQAMDFNNNNNSTTNTVAVHARTHARTHATWYN